MTTSPALDWARDLVRSGEYGSAAERLEAYLHRTPDSTEGRVLLAIAQVHLGSIAAAEANLRTVVESEPAHCEALVWLASIQRMAGALEEAIGLCGRAIQAEPEYAPAYNILGLSALTLGRHLEAAIAFEKLVRLTPDTAAGRRNLGLALRQLGRLEEAESAFREAVRLEPANEVHHQDLFHVAGERNAAEGIAILTAGLIHCPNSVNLWLALAKTCSHAHQVAEAENAYQRAVALDGNQGLAYGTWLQDLGRFDDSETVLRRLLRDNRACGAAYLALAEGARFRVEDETLVGQAKSVLRDPKVDAVEKACVCYALGKAYDRNKNYAEAARWFQEGNERAFVAHGSGRSFHPATIAGYPDKIAKIYARERLAECAPFGSDSEVPIFIVGMIRSGTTLLDQIVSAHPAVSAAGELPFWRVAGDRFNRKWYDSGIEGAEIERLQKPYLEMLTRESEGRPRVTDKMPLNYELLGLIHAAFPKAKILHIRRNPADTCLSIYQNYFGGVTNFAYSWDNIVVYYRSYQRFMEHWRSILPAGAMMELDYETLVSENEATVRRILAFLGLDWNDACLDPSANAGRVETPSKWQVRQPIYRGSIGKWRCYAQWFPQLDVLNNLQHPPLTPS